MTHPTGSADPASPPPDGSGSLQSRPADVVDAWRRAKLAVSDTGRISDPARWRIAVETARAATRAAYRDAVAIDPYLGSALLTEHAAEMSLRHAMGYELIAVDAALTLRDHRRRLRGALALAPGSGRRRRRRPAQCGSDCWARGPHKGGPGRGVGSGAPVSTVASGGLRVARYRADDPTPGDRRRSGSLQR